MTSTRVAVIGAGLAGLFTALALERRGVDDVVVLEAAPEAGGVARTLRRDGHVLEPGVGSLLLPHPHLSPLLDLIGHRLERAASSQRYVWAGGRLRSVSRPVDVLGLVPFASSLRLLAEPLVRPRRGETDESLHDLLSRRLGRRAGGLAADLMAAGVFAGDPHHLSAAAAFPLLAKLEAENGSLLRGAIARRRGRPPGTTPPQLHVPVDGFDALADAAARHLGSRLLKRFPVSALIRIGSGWRLDGPETIEAREVVVAVAAPEAGRLLGGELGRVLSQAVTAPVVVAAFSAPAVEAPLPEGFGALVTGGLATAGILFESSYSPARAPSGRTLVKVIAGGARHPEVAGWADDVIADRLGQEVQTVLGWTPQLELTAHRRLPQYPPGHPTWLAAIDREAGQNLHLTGWSYRGIGAGHVAADATRVADAVAGSGGH